MIRSLICSFAVVLPLAFGACTTDKDPEPAKQQAPVQKPAPVAEAVVHDVMCGCSIDGVGRCGNYILIDGKYVPMIHPTLGKMEWCSRKEKGAKVETVGAMKDGKFIAQNWKTLK